ncbi:sugar porter family MFS transporter [Mycobacterium decipiens]|uniref:sugar porter family MFS transporter n=1 Tax=Mycobacterium decipiens TaxID=1430326 RepID=UPI0013FDC1BA|nr:sugar porter family MFS transporter [Mycobacterium decipiens]
MAIVAAELPARPRPLRWRLFLVGGSAGTLFGYSIVVSNDAIEPIRQQYSLSGWAVGTVVSSLIAGALIGCLIAGRFVDRHGHRLVLGVAGVVAATGSIVSALAPGAPTITIGRLILGAAVGVTTAVAPTYIGEIAHVRNRGAMMAGYQFSIALGFLLSLTVGAILSFGDHQWRIMLAANAIPALVQAATMARVPSSPYSLVARGFVDQARESLMATRHPDEVAAELESIVSAHQRHDQTDIGTQATSLLRPIMIAMGAALMDTLVGICVIVPYSTAVFAMAGVGGRAGAEVASWSIGVVDVISTVVAMGLLTRYGRRPLLTVGLIGIIVALLATSVGLVESASTYAAIITIVAMLTFMACHAFSVGPIGWLLVAEVLPARIRSRGSGAAIGVNWLANLLVALLFPILVGSPGVPYRAAIGFLAFAVISAGFLIFVRVCVPETRGLSLAEVEAKFAARTAKPERHGQPAS